MKYPWHKSQWQLLLAQYQRQSVHHALLFAGPSGLGKKDCAHSFVQLLVCEQPHESTAACGQCKSCRWYLDGNHPDCFEMTLQDKAKTIKIEQIRELTTALSQASHQGGYQTVLIQPADTLTLASCNALLKTLEEPTGKVVFVLVTNHMDRLPATVRSRCQLVPFQIDQFDVAKQWLQQQAGVESLPMDMLLRAAHGAPLLALEYAQNDYCETRDSLLQQLLQLSQKHQNPVAIAVSLAKQDVLLILAIFLALLGDMMKLHVAVSSEYLVYHDCVSQLNTLTQNICPDMLFRCFENVSQTRMLLQSNTGINVQLALESLLIDWIALTTAS